MADSVIAAPYLRQHTAQVGGGADVVVAVLRRVGGDGLLLDGRRREGEKHQPYAGGRQRKTAPHAVAHGTRITR